MKGDAVAVSVPAQGEELRCLVARKSGELQGAGACRNAAAAVANGA